MEESATPTDTQLNLLRQCLGLPSVDTVADCNDKPTVSGVTAVSVGLPAGFLLEPRLLHTISCKWKKDRKPCGITDIALTDDGQVFVADFLNKAVKIYGCIKVGLQIFLIIVLKL